MKKLGFGLLLALFIYTAASPAPNPGVVYEIEVKDHEQSPPKTESIQAAVEGRHLKMGIASRGKGSEGEMIYRGDRREVIVVDDDKRTYVVMNKETIGNIAGQVGEAQKMMEEAIKNLPKEQRDAIEKARKQGGMGIPGAMTPRAKTELKKTGERGDKEGYPCVKYEVLRDGKKIRELWVTDWDNIEGHEEAQPTFEDFAGFLQELLDGIGELGGGGMDDNMFEHMKEIGGFPVVTRDFGDDGSLEGETTLRSAKRQYLDPDAFEPPSGYKRQEMFGGQ